MRLSCWPAFSLYSVGHTRPDNKRGTRDTLCLYISDTTAVLDGSQQTIEPGQMRPDKLSLSVLAIPPRLLLALVPLVLASI